MSATIPDTIGAEKLVPTFTFVWFVYVCAPGVVAPRLDVVSIENRQGPPLVLTQLPPGALTAICGP
jgi:hypothetical protein